MADSLPSRALRTIRRHGLLPRGGRVLVAISGGADSVTLLHVLLELQARGALAVAGAGHFNHRLRPAAAEDERFCRALVDELGVPLQVGSADVRGLARAERRSIEDAARRARYTFLGAAAERVAADAIAVGHSREDQAETFLLRLLRGAGSRGLAGIHPCAGRVIRPFLDIPRVAIRDYAAARGLRFREDESNADVSVPRNRVRHELLPLLARFSPSAVEAVARAAESAREDEDFLNRAAIDLSGSIVLMTDHGAVLDAPSLSQVHPALASRVVRAALEQAAPGVFFSREHIRAVLALAAGDWQPAAGRSVTLDVPGLTAWRDGERVVLGVRRIEPAAFANSFRFPLSIPGEVALPGWMVSAQASTADRGVPGALTARGPAVLVAGSVVKLPLAVRSRRPGDRFRPIGMGGRGRKLQDFLVDRKVARADRDALPLVVDSDDRIVWVVGHSVGEDFRVTSPSQGVILLKARRLGGEG
ncbi:MAG TPA: tRNA lysidine(34) synthetase TilS [Vicinamibacterales bacterium]|nr:tRNA lysidine(34) synthetase TilS [Vicinamibacterales bacterium]